ncbi:MAG: type II toxin-antitoxin system PemK/MazF family toxin [Candidatus Latescibacter sp.]|nr:type II toxin-antitoxin system PemK/MazF family toxin [Candidatus Latescibacter sp.]
MEMVKVGEVRRGDVFLINLNPTIGDEIEKVRPCLVVSPDELNLFLKTFIVAPLTTGGYLYPFRVPCRFHGKSGFVVLDQIRTVDRDRFVRHVGKISPSVLKQVLGVLQEMFSP